MKKVTQFGRFESPLKINKNLYFLYRCEAFQYLVGQIREYQTLRFWHGSQVRIPAEDVHQGGGDTVVPRAGNPLGLKALL